MDIIELDNIISANIRIKVNNFEATLSIGLIYLWRNLNILAKQLRLSGSGVFEYDSSPPALIYKVIDSDRLWLAIDSYGTVVAEEEVNLKEFEAMLQSRLGDIAATLRNIDEKLLELL